jgi:pimeloyl-ACP methyl ester carboxylesterase
MLTTCTWQADGGLRVSFAAGTLFDAGDLNVAKPTKLPSKPADAVRTRRAYFDCRFGQLHVRTAFPTTGGFDEQVTLFCLHPQQTSSRIFSRLLPEIADVRSVYAPDLPGCGESDHSPAGSIAQAAEAILDLANDLRLRQIDLLGVHAGAGVALQLAATQPQLVRRLALVGAPGPGSLPTVSQQALLMRTRSLSADDVARAKAAVPHGIFVDIADYADDLFDAAPKTLAKQIGEFLSGA